MEQLSVYVVADVAFFGNYYGGNGFLCGRKMASFIASKLVRIAQILFVEKGFYFAQLAYLLAVNLALGGGAAYILADLIMKHYGF